VSLTNSPDMRPAAAVRVAPRLAVTHLLLTNFRSYTLGEIAVSGRPVVLAGPNGAGKTNILDAISLLSPGRGLRGARLGEHTRRGRRKAMRCGRSRRPSRWANRPMRSAPD